MWCECFDKVYYFEINYNDQLINYNYTFLECDEHCDFCIDSRFRWGNIRQTYFNIRWVKQKWDFASDRKYS